MSASFAALTVVLPLAVAAMLPFVGRATKGLVPLVALSGPVITLWVGVTRLLGGHEVEAARGQLPWFAQTLPVTWTVDTLAGVMLVVVGVVASMVMIFSIGYMHGDPGWSRYYALISVFTASMNLLVISDGFVALFFGWELVGACSYLLIGFWFEKESAAKAAIKAFLTTRVGDVGLLLGMGVLLAATGSLDYAGVFEAAKTQPVWLVTTAAMLIAVGAFGKSAQFPLQIWLPDAMEGPTPVSALIHAATMVAAGVYLIARTWPLFELAPGAQTLVLAVGTISALGAALAAVAQTDIKKVLAYSTISQLGFMFAALGVGAWGVAMFHLVTHAAFKALLFLGAGSVIHGSGTQDLREMGGLRRFMPYTFVTWLLGSLALAGIPPLSGFFSKDEILASMWHSGATAAGVALTIAAFTTAFYVSRTTYLAFFGSNRGEGHPHESPANMWVPLAILSFFAAVLGFAGEPILELIGAPISEFSWVTAITSTLVAVAGLGIGWLSISNAEAPRRILEERLGRVWTWAQHGWGWDWLVLRLARGTASAARAVWAVGDRLVIDGAAEGAAGVARGAGRALSTLQTGEGQWYAALIALGAALALAAVVVVR